MNETIPQEIKTKIMTLYYGQDVFVSAGKKYAIDHSVIKVWGRTHQKRGTGWTWHLSLKPLHLISDEDAIEVVKVAYPGYEFESDEERICDAKDLLMPLWGGEQKHHRLYRIGQPLPIIDFLRSHGYALPAFGYTIDQLVQAGVFKLR